MVCILTPFTLAFSDWDEVDKNKTFILVNNSIDIYFTVDIIINMNTAFENSQHQMVDSRCPIFCNYLKSWLIIDLLSVFPLEWIFKMQ
jgi:hypothetical protein